MSKLALVIEVILLVLLCSGMNWFLFYTDEVLPISDINNQTDTNQSSYQSSNITCIDITLDCYTYGNGMTYCNYSNIAYPQSLNTS